MESRIKKIVGKMRAWYGEYKEYRRVKRMDRVMKLAKRRSREEVQIMEYGGEMYICYRGVPIVRERDLGAPWGGVLARNSGLNVFFTVWSMASPAESPPLNPIFA